MSDTAFYKVARLLPMFESQLLTLSDDIKAQAYDIRLKAGQPLTICGREGIFFLCGDGRVTKNSERNVLICREETLTELFLQLCSHSVFSHENEIRQGYITVQQAYRVGICGTAVLESGQMKNIRDIRSMVFRIPREKRGCARPLFLHELDFSKGILIVGEPSSGKTTFIRDIVEAFSFGMYSAPKRMAVLDERCEIESIFDLGPCADIFKGYPKAEGFSMALRTMSPEIIVCDELSQNDQAHICQAMYCGIPVIATVHANEADLLYKNHIYQMLKDKVFDTVVFLHGRKCPGQVKRIVKAGELLERLGDRIDYSQRPDAGIHAGAKTKKQKIGVA